MSDLPKTVMTRRNGGITCPVTLETPSSARNITNVTIVPMTVLKQVLVRALRTYVMSLSGLLAAGGLGADRDVLPHDFVPLLWTCSGIALAPTVMSILANVAELLSKIDESFPQMRA